jgi:predicted outer membrane repeat protein
MKKAVIAVAAVLVFIFTLTQKSEAVTATDWSELSGFLGDSTDYYSSPIELTADLSGVINKFDLSADKTITSAPGQSFSLTFDAPRLRDNKKKLMFQNLGLLTFSNATDSAIKNENLSLITFDRLTVKFLSNSAYYGGAIFNRSSTVSFVNSTVNFVSNTADDYGGAINNQDSTLSFVNSIVGFSGNRTTINGGAIFNDASGTLIFKGGSRAIFEDNHAPQAKGADRYNNGISEISERSEVIVRSGIDGNPTKGGVINIKSGTLTISADKIFIRVINVSAGGKFSLVDRQAIFPTVYTTKTAQIDSLTVAGILEIGIDLSTDNINDLISSADSITFQKGSSLKIVPFNKWSSPKTYSIIFEGDLRGFENLDYDRSRFVLSYDNKTKTLSLRVISDPTK